MCGITGFVSNKHTVDDLTTMTNTLYHRGPDGYGVYYKEGVGLGHRRLSILELTDLGKQPYFFENLIVTYNGEIYNYGEIRKKLEKKGYSFSSNSDTEVLIKAFHCWREKAVHQFIGMFAFAVYDVESTELFLFRDRLGVKPLYYYWDQEILIFASEVKAISTVVDKKKVSQAALEKYFTLGFIGGSTSIYENIFKLEPGHYLHFQNKKLEKYQYWNIYDFHNSSFTDNSRKEEDWLDELEDVLISSFKYRMVSDVPVGVFLSGGIDSSLLTAILQKEFAGIHTFTIGFKDAAFNEAPFAKAVAEYLGTEHHEKILDINEAKQLLENFYGIFDEPFSDSSGIPTALVAQVAKQAGMKVVLSADGGDELFCGYGRYNLAFNAAHKFFSLNAALRESLAKVLKFSPLDRLLSDNNLLNISHKYYVLRERLEAKSFMDIYYTYFSNLTQQELNLLLKGSERYINGEVAKDSVGIYPIQQMMLFDLVNYLPDNLLVKTDRATMYHSIEGREPFLDHRIVELSARMPFSLKYRDGVTKYALRKLLSRYLPSKLFDRPKQGFSIPLFSLISTDKSYRNFLEVEKLKRISEYFEDGVITKEINRFEANLKRGKEYNTEKMWRIISFMMWVEKMSFV